MSKAPGLPPLSAAALLLFVFSWVPTAAIAGEGSLPKWVELDLEYRVRTLYIDPMELSGTTVRDVNYTIQRLRVDGGFQIPEIVRLVTQVDLLSGVLFGDNGDYGGSPSPTQGLALTSRWPNAAGWRVGLVGNNADPFDPDSYGMVLTEVNPIQINRIYGEVMLPFGLLRVGRQPITEGAGINLHDGGRHNRWGVSKYSSSADRFLFATKISEAFRMVRQGKDYTPDRSMDDGVFLGLAYDMVVQDDLTLGGDDLHQAAGSVIWKAREPSWFGWDWDHFLFQVTVGGRFGDEFGTRALSIPAVLDFAVGRWAFRGEFATIFGNTREVSEGMQALREADAAKRVIRNQEILGFGARAVLDATFGPVMATLEFDYASGDADPRDETAFTSFSFARDRNVGLLLFEHILAFETARSAAVGIENLANVGASSFPLTELSSDGRFQNGIVLFPQVLYKPWDVLGIRFGSMFAWSAAPVVDPIMTLLNEDGNHIDDDAVNWHGGKPGRYYGTELDLQVEFAWKEHFLWTVEGAVLLPGDALQDESGDAVPSFLVENRFTFLF